jgi:anti-sigma factor RsiW
MNCKVARESWHAQCDGELPPVERAALALHCERCPECRAYVQDMDAIARSLADLRAATDRVGQPASTAVSPTGPFKWATGVRRVAAAVAMVLGAGVIAYLGAVDSEHGPSLPSSTPRVVPSTELSARMPAVQVALLAESDERFIPVTRDTSRPNVHLFVLFERP